VQTGARRLETDGTFDDALAYLNPDKSVVVVLRNESGYERAIDVAVGGMKIPAAMPPDSLTTLLWKPS
jgi:glucosylceramidase